MATDHDHARRSMSPLWATNAALQAKVNRLEAENLKLYIQNVSMRFKLEVEKSREAEVPRMAMTSAERQKAYRERVKAKAVKEGT